ncbi:DUF3796 domain-containing protein [Anaerolentibacter hominis]|uniref:DUF3796 domain-containing protein n=1 Tax=Anaerolentibacter hominis TaxID=3079009 RepID=UPI0031B88F13
MKKKRFHLLIVLIVLELAACAYDVIYNESRIVKPLDLASYQFRAGDLPLMVMTVLLVLYVIIQAIRYFAENLKKGKVQEANRTRTVSPRFGWFGFFGLIGFLGIPAYITQQQVWPFFFFIFFGFFGFFYEGKLSSTLIDERFKEEQMRAQLTSYRLGFTLLWIVTWFTGVMGDRLRTDYVALIFTVASSLIIALVLFLNNYLLYKYDTGEE